MSKAAKPKVFMAKPVMRNIHHNRTLQGIIIAVSASIISGTIFHFAYRRPRKKAYEEFYENYDADKSFNRMMQAGLLNSCPPVDENEGKCKKRF